MIEKPLKISNLIKNTFNNKKNFKKLPTDFEIKKKQNQAILKLPNEEHIASIIIACDGANSKVRDKIAINLLRHNFNQTALSFELKVNTEIQKQAFQFFLKESTLAVLPIRQGLVSIVWSCNANFFTKLNGLNGLNDKSIEYELSQIIGNFYKDIKITSKKESFDYATTVLVELVPCLSQSLHFCELAGPIAASWLESFCRGDRTVPSTLPFSLSQYAAFLVSAGTLR